MNIQNKYYEAGLKYGVPLALITATIAMKKTNGIGKFAIFAITAPTLVGFLYSLLKVKENQEEY